MVCIIPINPPPHPPNHKNRFSKRTEARGLLMSRCSCGQSSQLSAGPKPSPKTSPKSRTLASTLASPPPPPPPVPAHAHSPSVPLCERICSAPPSRPGGGGWAARKRLSPKKPKRECMWMQTRYQVRVGLSWGGLPSTLEPRWTELNCDGLLVTQTSERKVQA